MLRTNQSVRVGKRGKGLIVLLSLLLVDLYLGVTFETFHKFSKRRKIVLLGDRHLS